MPTSTPQIAAQANRYFTAVHGPDWVYKAPEQFPNLVEQWIWALAAADLELAEQVMTRLETMAAEAKTPEVSMPSAPATVEACPECRSGKHANCAGWALDQADEQVPCPCAEQDHR